LGITDHVDLVDQHVALERGDTIVFYTDGVIEAHEPGEPMLGQERLLEIIAASAGRSPAAIADRILDAATRQSVGEPQDDMALLLVQIQG
jgi:serine phosphatase RsbU (regulator of sigma subunit)